MAILQGWEPQVVDPTGCTSCTAQTTDPADTWACTAHFGPYHVADLGDGHLRLWLDRPWPALDTSDYTELLDAVDIAVAFWRGRDNLDLGAKGVLAAYDHLYQGEAS